jgi:hypothetical protein
MTSETMPKWRNSDRLVCLSTGIKKDIVVYNLYQT